MDTDIFELAPIAMWIEDFGAVKAQFDIWRSAGIVDIRAFLKGDIARVMKCSSKIRVLRVNRKTLELFEATDIHHLRANLDRVFRDDMLERHIDELTTFWNGGSEFSGSTVNYTLSGRRLDIQLRVSAMPGYEKSLGKLLVTTEDVTEREAARRAEQDSRRYAEGIFEHSPISLWIEDFSEIREMIQNVRNNGITDFGAFMDTHPAFVRQCMDKMNVIDVNKATLDLYCAPSLEALLQHLPEIFGGEMEKAFRGHLLALWEGRLSHHCEVVNHALDGTWRHVIRTFSVLPGHTSDWSRVQVAVTDITARKEAEAHLEFLGTHDVLTELHNRAFYTKELERLEASPVRPVSAIVLDLNGLKKVNDQFGHIAGDALLRRFGEILVNIVKPPNHAARVGGDEFVVLMPGTDEQAANALARTIHELLKINNQLYRDIPISVSLGMATSKPGESMESLMIRADAHMYQCKRAHYADGLSIPEPMRDSGA